MAGARESRRVGACSTATTPFFTFTKRLHNLLHGLPGDGSAIPPEDVIDYHQVLADNRRTWDHQVRLGDVVVLHDPQVAGLATALRDWGAHVVWRCQVGTAQHNEYTDAAWALLRGCWPAASRNSPARSTSCPPQITAAIHARTPQLLERYGVGPDTAAALLLTAGDNPERLTDEASFAALCGVSPTEASSGKTQRRRLNRGGDRRANSALYTIIIARLRWDKRTQAYVQRPVAEGKTRREAIRGLKRYIARELYRDIAAPPPRAPGHEPGA